MTHIEYNPGASKMHWDFSFTRRWAFTLIRIGNKKSQMPWLCQDIGIVFAEAVLFWINEINPDALSLLKNSVDTKKRMRISAFRFLFAEAVLIWITQVIPFLNIEYLPRRQAGRTRNSEHRSFLKRIYDEVKRSHRDSTLLSAGRFAAELPIWIMK